MTLPPRNTEEWMRWVERRLTNLDRHRHPEAKVTAEGALADAGVAKETADVAQETADQAASDAAEAITRTDSKTSNFYQEDPPPAEGRTEGDIWVRTSDQRVHFWYGEWVDVSNLGGTSIFYGPTAPTAEMKMGDLWLQTPQNIAYRYDGDSWEPVRDQGIVQALLDAQAAQEAAEQADANALAAAAAATTAQSTADSASLAAQAAQQAASSAQGDADGAATAAATAQAAANAAASEAATARQEAQSAEQQALDALGVAEGKGKVYYQATAPAGDANGLWIDTDDGNKPYRWNGSTWVLVQDQAIVAAAGAAAAAQSDADAAASAAAAAQAAAQTAQDDATAALTAAATAQSAADDAQATADGKVRTFFQAAAPTGLVAGDVGDLWFDTDDSNKMYRWTGSVWAVSDDQRIATALTNASSAQTTANSKIVTFYQAAAPATTGRTTGDLWVDTDDGNKLYRWSGSAWTAVPFGAGAISATARQLGAITIYKQTAAPTSGMIAGDYWLDSDDGNKPYRYSGSVWENVQDQAVVTAINNAATAQSTADGKVRIFVQATAPTGLVAGDVGDLWIDSDDGNRMWTWGGSAWTDRRLGNSAIQPQSLIASDVIATGTVSAALLEVTLILATDIIAGDPAGSHARMTPTGFKVFAENPEGGAPYEAARMGSDTNDNFAITDAAGNLKATIDDTGRGSFTGLSVTADPILNGRTLSAWLDDRPRGLVAIGQMRLNGQNTTTELGLFDVTATLHPGRAYRIAVSGGVLRADAANMEIGYRVRFKMGGAAPTVTDPSIVNTDNQHDQNRWHNLQGESVWYAIPGTGVSSVVRFLLTIFAQPAFGGSVTQIDSWPTISIYDIGRQVSFSQTPNTGGGSSSPVQQRYVWETEAAWSQTYRGTGAVRTDTTDVVQGYNSTNGDGKGYIGWNLPSITGTVEKAEVYLYSNHWYYNSGGWAIIGYHNHTAAPGSWTDSSGRFVHATKFPKPGGMWVDISGWKDLFKTNAGARGVSLGPQGGTDLNYYGRFDGAGGVNKPRLRLTYVQ